MDSDPIPALRSLDSALASAGPVPAPGARVVIRDAEWVIRRVDRCPDGGYQLVCDGVSELVREREAIFLTSLESDIQVLDPADTRLVPDESPGFADSRLYVESQLRQAVPNDEYIHVAHGAAMDPAPYQLEPARQALRQPRQRILIADAVGLGKTLEAGILVSELIARGRGRRILVLAVKSMLTQFQKEFWNRFTVPLTRLDSIGIQRVRSRIPTSHNPFHYYDKSIISIDTLKQDAEYRTYLEQAYWDIIVIDEAHNVADRGAGGGNTGASHGRTSLRSRLARLLARRSDTLIMLSATPHDGRARSFASLVNMLDATAIANPDIYSKEDFRDKGLVIRRFKKDIRTQVRNAFRDREIVRRRFPASAAEEAAYEALLAVRVASSRAAGPGTGSQRRDLFLVTLEKALFSSPAACIASVDQRLRRRERELAESPEPACAAEVESLQALRQVLTAIAPNDYAKYQALLAAVRGGKPFDWNGSDPRDRLVVFTERIETLKWLRDRLAKDLRLRDDQVEILHGGLSDVDQQRLVEDFGNAARPLRLLICSDVASEGINLHFQCHRLIHFDMPWSLMVFQQRNGRVDRYGQERTPHIVYLVTESANETIRGDTRILEVLAEKDEQAHRNIGDPSAFMRVYDIEAEEDITRKAIAAGEQADRFDARLSPAASEGDDLLALFLGTHGPEDEPSPEAPEPPPTPASLFESDLAYCEAALHRLRERDRTLRFESDVTGTVLTLDAPEDLRRRFGYFPRKVTPENGRFALTADRNCMRDAIADSRREETAWPTVHYLWRLNPVVGWLNDRMLAAFGRHEAPVLAGAPGLAADETVFVLSGLVPNRRSHPLLYEWLAVSYRGTRFEAVVPFDEVIARTGLGRDGIANRSLQADTDALRRLLPDAVARARAWVVERRRAFESRINEKLNDELEALEKLKTRQLRQLELQLERSEQAEAFKRARQERGQRDIDTIFKEYLEWVQETMTTEPQPYIKVVCVMTGESGNPRPEGVRSG